MELTLIITGGVLLGCLLGLSWFAGSDAPYVPTKMVRIRKVLKEVSIKKGEIFWELGSGDGRVVIEASKMGAKAYGIEQSWIRVLLSRWNAKKLNLPNARFIHGNIFSLSFWGAKRLQNPQNTGSWTCFARRASQDDIENADIIFIFLLPKGVEKLEPILKKNLKKGARVITQTFYFKSWKPYKKVLITDKDLFRSHSDKSIVLAYRTLPFLLRKKRKNITNKLLGKNKYEGDFWFYRV